MENNRTYLRHFGLLFLLFTLLAALVAWQFSSQRPDSYNQFSLFTVIVEFLPGILTLSAVGFATGNRNAAIGSIVLSVSLKVLLFLIRSDFNIESGNQGLKFWLNQLAFLSPYMLFLVLSKPEIKRIPLLLAGTLLVYGDNNMFAAMQGIEKLNEYFSLGWNIPAYIPYCISYLLSLVTHFLLLCELVNYGQGKTAGYRPRLLNPGNEYSKLTGTLVFWSLKIFILLSIIGCPFTLETFARYTSVEEYSYLSSMSFLKWYYLLSILSTIPLMFCAAWYLRKFLMEYFMTWQHTSRLLYWFLLLPVVGFFAWLVMLADSDKNHSFAQRKKTLGDFSSSSKNGIITVFLILLGIRLLITLTNGPSSTVITVVLSAALFFAMVSSRGGYYFNFYLNILVMAALLLILLFGKGAGGDYILLFYPIILFNVLQVILIFPALHIEAFEYISYEEEKPWQPGDDLF